MVSWARLEACKRHEGYKLNLYFLVFTSKTAMKSKNTGCDNGDLFGHIQCLMCVSEQGLYVCH